MKAVAPLRPLVALGSCLLACVLAASTAQAQQIHWIWSPAHEQDKIPAGDCYFRKTFALQSAEAAEVELAADDAYELYVNGRHVGSGNNWKVLDKYNILPYLVRGTNTVAVKATCREAGAAGLAARIVIKPQGAPHVVLASDESWKTSLEADPRWTRPEMPEDQWVPAQSFGPLGATLPWGNETHLAGNVGRFKTLPNFEIARVVEPERTGSLIAMTFNEFGHLIVSRENGPLLRVTDSDGDGELDEVTTYCDQVTNCQGLLALNGDVLAVGQGPDGAALYRLSDEDQDRKAEKVETLLRFSGTMREHGAHGLALGPDGLIYVVVGNHATIDAEHHQYAAGSPLRDYYEGDLVQPRYEDPGGHAVGIKAPGGTVLRLDAQGHFVELVAGGLRNAYDLAFNRQGDLFTYDSDMEWNIGLPFYRPTRLNHIVPGAEFGWRSGWAKWPSYYLDGLPATAELGPGSPTGVVFYNHFMFPVRFHNAMFVSDWAGGKIEVVRLRREGGGYTADTNVVVEGRPLNATDLAVGPDGWLYFCTGGRDTEGGVYRLSWTGNVPPEVKQLGAGIERALRQPQLESAWARQQVAKIRRELGDQWAPQLVAVARDATKSVPWRTRALELMQLLGPFPPTDLLLDLSADRQPAVRIKAAYLLGIHADHAARGRLVELLDDENAGVRRVACEALTRGEYEVPASRLVALLSDADRHVAFAARRALERIPTDRWRDEVLNHPRTRVFLHGATALLTAAPTRENALAVAARCAKMLAGDVHDPSFPPGFISDHDFTDLLRVVQIALIRGELQGADVPELRKLLAREYPSSDAIMNRELVRLLVALGEPSVTERMADQLKADIPNIEKIHLAMHAPFLKEGWTSEQKLLLVQFYEEAHILEGGENLSSFLDICCRDLMRGFTPQERRAVLARGVEWPHAALSALGSLEGTPEAATLAAIVALDKQLRTLETDEEEREEDEAVTRLRTGIVAVLGQSKTDPAMAYLRELYEAEPARRETIAVGLAQAPGGDNWPLLVRSLSILEGPLASEVLQKLAGVERRPDDAAAVRQAILCGLRLQERGGPQAVALLEHWTGARPVAAGNDWKNQLASWQSWFARTYPQMPKAELPVEPPQSKWSYEELVSYLTGDAADAADPHRGALVFEQAQCAKCHRFGGRGASVGPDLTTVSRRFQKKEILRSIIFPSHVISDQYASQKILTTDGRALTGIAAPAGQEAITLIGADGRKTLLRGDQIEDIQASSVSVMPQGLLDALTLQQIADLFAYLGHPPRHNITSRRGAAPR